MAQWRRICPSAENLNNNIYPKSSVAPHACSYRCYLSKYVFGMRSAVRRASAIRLPLAFGARKERANIFTSAAGGSIISVIVVYWPGKIEDF